MVKQKLLFATLFVAFMALPGKFAIAQPVEVDLGFCLIDPSIPHDDGHRSPVLIPEVSIDSYTLLFMTPCDGCLLRVVGEDGGVEDSTLITGNTLVLPSTLSGSYELQIIRGNYVFYGDITL